ncbi:MAG: hypothetical protein KJN66_04590 [Bacteroidia bacterium]|nr:hypothetical protein [Bacteroidia bacterium]
MKTLMFICFIAILTSSCNTTKKTVVSDSELMSAKDQDTVRIANDELEYEIIIIDPGFNPWLLTQARPRNYHDQFYLESRNKIMVTEWNNRVLLPGSYSPSLYEWQINYDPNIDYGYEVNYLLYNYFLYFQLKYKQRLSHFIPRI